VLLVATAEMPLEEAKEEQAQNKLEQSIFLYISMVATHKTSYDLIT